MAVGGPVEHFANTTRFWQHTDPRGLFALLPSTLTQRKSARGLGAPLREHQRRRNATPSTVVRTAILSLEPCDTESEQLRCQVYDDRHDRSEKKAVRPSRGAGSSCNRRLPWGRSVGVC